MKLRELWNYQDAKRGALMGIIASLLYYIMIGQTSIFGYRDLDFETSYVEPYGRLWYLLNPYFQQWQIYSITTVLIYTAIIAPQIWLAKKGKINRWILILNVLTMIFFRRVQSNQDITVIAFAPLATINPIFSIFLLLQKMALGFSWNLSDVYWYDWTHQVANNPFQVSYFFLIFWFIFPIAVWAQKKWKILK